MVCLIEREQQSDCRADPVCNDAGWRAGLRQRQGEQMPAGAVPGMADGMPANLLRMRRGAGMQVRMVRIDLKALVQLAVVAVVLYQVCLLALINSVNCENVSGCCTCVGS